MLKKIRNFFGSGYGKGFVDGCSGVVKLVVYRVMIVCIVINSVIYFFDYFKVYFIKNESYFKRIFNFDRIRLDKIVVKIL